MAEALAAMNYTLIATGGSEHTRDGMYRPRWWESGSRDEMWLGQDPLVWAAPDLRAGHPAFTAARPFADLLAVARAEYPPAAPSRFG